MLGSITGIYLLSSIMSILKRLRHSLVRHPGKVLAGALSVSVLAFSAAHLFSGPQPVDLSESPSALTHTMLAEWNDGDVIVFVRHLERCSRVDAPCIDDEPSGITQRSTPTGLAMREQFLELGLATTDMYSSPLTRTSQTSELLFVEPVPNQDFLYQCEENFMQQALAQKTPGRNLVLVTHSSCMDEVNLSLGYAEVDYEYGAAVFMNVQSATEQTILGFIDNDDWLKTLAPHS